MNQPTALREVRQHIARGQFAAAAEELSGLPAQEQAETLERLPEAQATEVEAVSKVRQSACYIAGA